jgi:multiple sugar transport system ATP-binding protein
MNFFPATLADGRAQGAGFTLPVRASLRGEPAGRRVVIGIRPEDLMASREEAHGETASLPVAVELVEPLGDAVLVHGIVGEAPVIGKLEPRRAPRAGDEVDLWVELDRMHVFDAETSRRIE